MKSRSLSNLLNSLVSNILVFFFTLNSTGGIDSSGILAPIPGCGTEHLRCAGSHTSDQHKDDGMDKMPEQKCVQVEGIHGSIRYKCWHFNPVTYGIIPENALTLGCDFPDYSPSVLHHSGIGKALNAENYQVFIPTLPANAGGQECLLNLLQDRLNQPA